MTVLRLVVFDVDGTLVDSLGHIVAAMTEAFTRTGLPAPVEEDVRAIVGLSLPVAVARLLPEVSSRDHAALVDAYRAAWIAQGRAGNAAPLFPGARAVLDRLSQAPSVLLGIATGKSRRGLLNLIEVHGLSGHFSTIQTADHHPSKPHPAMLAAALAETGVGAAGAVIVGDTTYDIEMAAAAGVAGLGVAWGCHPPAALVAAGAKGVVDSFADLETALDAIWSEPA